MTSLTLNAGARDRAAPRTIARWLLFCCGMVYAMAVIGAITRLTESGLSMVEWRPLIGFIPPLSEAEWQRVFDLYRQTPEYRYVNTGMTLEEFKGIFFWEWFHRLWGRLIGVAFALPLAWFALTRRIPHGLGLKLAGLLLLGGLQGFIGWFMVQSGLIDRPSVSHYRLALHLGMAFLVYALMLWMALDLLNPAPASGRSAGAPAVRRHASWALAAVAVTATWGAFVAGLDAGLAYNTFPLMGGHLAPPEMWTLQPAWINLFENTAAVQFIHRWLGLATGLFVLVLWARTRAAGLAPRGRRLADALALAVLGQIGLGIATLLLAVPIVLGAAHQAGALLVITLLVMLRHELKAPAPAA